VAKTGVIEDLGDGAKQDVNDDGSQVCG